MIAPTSPKNLVQVFIQQAEQYTSRPALWFKDRLSGHFLPVSWTEWALWVRRTAMALHALGIRSGHKAAILSENRAEWTFADLGILSLGAVTVPIYPTSSLPEILYVLKHSESRIVFCSSREQCAAILSARSECPALRHVIVFAKAPVPQGAVAYSAFLEEGRLALLDGEVFYRRLTDAVGPDDLATLIYTSGTTGPPKGVMLTHRNFMENYRLARAFIQAGPDDAALSFLPLSHVFERLAGYYFMMASGASIAYAESMNTVPQDIREVRPTISAAVPRFYEKVHAKISEQVKQKSPLAQRLFGWALKTGERYQKARREGTVPVPLKIKHALACSLALGKIRKAMGGRLRFFISGGAPLSRPIAEFFYAAGILILEGYGLTETSPVIAVNAERDFMFGTVGRPLPGIEVKIAPDGEILTRSACVMKGYYRDPEATRNVIQDGWFSTGDIGAFNEQGFLVITDRKKDLIVTSGGKNIAPQNIEKNLAGSPLIQQAVVLGDRKNYLVALIVPQREEILKRLREAGLPAGDWESALRLPEVRDWMARAVEEQTREMAAYEKIKYFALLGSELTQESGELTPTLKVKRRVIMQKYQDVIEALYREGDRLHSPQPRSL